MTNGLQIVVLFASTDREIDEAGARLAQSRAEALLIMPTDLFLQRREHLAALALGYRVPSIYAIRAFPDAGGLMSYGSSFTEAHRLVGTYAGRILKGEKPADLPAIRPTKFEFVINLKIAKALGLTIPPSMLATADAVIE